MPKHTKNQKNEVWILIKSIKSIKSGKRGPGRRLNQENVKKSIKLSLPSKQYLI